MPCARCLDRGPGVPDDEWIDQIIGKAVACACLDEVVGVGTYVRTMAKSRPAAAAYQCNECGWETTKWVGRCGECQAWGTVVERSAPSSPAHAGPLPAPALPLRAIPLGTAIHNIEIIPGRGAQMIRSAGGQAVLANREGGYALIKLASGEIRRINEDCFATIGQVGNSDHMNVSAGKAGRTRWLGRRPHVRGMVMNPVDHPMGGGQGKSKGGGGRHHPMSPWGQLAKGFKTRRKHKASDRFIVERRRSKKAK